MLADTTLRRRASPAGGLKEELHAASRVRACSTTPRPRATRSVLAALRDSDAAAAAAAAVAAQGAEAALLPHRRHVAEASLTLPEAPCLLRRSQLRVSSQQRASGKRREKPETRRTGKRPLFKYVGPPTPPSDAGPRASRTSSEPGSTTRPRATRSVLAARRRCATPPRDAAQGRDAALRQVAEPRGCASGAASACQTRACASCRAISAPRTRGGGHRDRRARDGVPGPAH
jgi:hypothetical protein